MASDLDFSNVWWSDAALDYSPSSSPSMPELEFDCDEDFLPSLHSVDGSLTPISPVSSELVNLDDLSSGELTPTEDELLCGASLKTYLLPMDNSCVSPLDTYFYFNSMSHCTDDIQQEHMGMAHDFHPGPMGSATEMHSEQQPLSKSILHQRQQDKMIGCTTPVDQNAESSLIHRPPQKAAKVSSKRSSSGKVGSGKISRKSSPKLCTSRRPSKDPMPSPTGQMISKSHITDQQRKGHNEVERNYRNRLNSQFQLLMSLLPDGESEGSTTTTKKAMVLERARRRIMELENENELLARELKGLSARGM